MHGVMKAKGINFGETKTDKILDKINPETQRKTENVDGRFLNPNLYNAKYFGHKIYYNQNEKLGMLGVIHVCVQDEFSSKIVGHATMARKKKHLICEEVYRLMITFFSYKDNTFQISQIF